MTRRRLDKELVARGLVSNEAEARRAIAEHRVLIDGASAVKTTTLVHSNTKLKINPVRRFVSRGGEKLDGALEDLRIDPSGRRCLDAGASTGGFTDALLRKGAASVVAVDVGYGQFDWSLRNDARVGLLERTNLRTADPASLGGPFDLLVADLSFISLEAVLDQLIALAHDSADLVLLVKPQFEAPRGEVPRGGVVTDPSVWRNAIERVARALGKRGWGTARVVASRLVGAEGNREFFLWARADARSSIRSLIDAAIP